MRKRSRSAVAFLLLIAFAAMPAIALAQACSFLFDGVSKHASGHRCAPISKAAPSACETQCNPEIALDSGPAVHAMPLVAPPIVVEIPQLDTRAAVLADVVPTSGAPPPLVRFCRLLI